MVEAEMAILLLTMEVSSMAMGYKKIIKPPSKTALEDTESMTSIFKEERELVRVPSRPQDL